MMTNEPTRGDEVRAFLWLTAVVVPTAAVMLVGAYGLAVWVYQMFAGPPGA